MSNGQWLLKRRNYGGGQSVVSLYSHERDAQDDAEMLNDAYQSDTYHVEPYDSAKAEGFTNPALVQLMVAKITGGA